jgi:proline iminopeptidase
MRSLWNAALCLFLMLTLTGSATAQQKREMTDSDKVRRLDIVPVPAPTQHPRLYPGTSFRSLRVPELAFGYVTANNQNFFYERIGYGTENIVVVHGGPGLPHNYLLPALHNIGQYATIWFYDARGHGISEQNRANDPYTMQRLADDVGAFVAALGLENYTLFGHSFGGMVALKYATGNPVGLRRLILSDTAASAEYASELRETLKRVMPSSQYEQYEKALGDESLTPDTRLRKALRIVYPYYWYHPPRPYHLDQDVLSMNLNARAADEIWSSDGMNFDVRNKLGSINVPTLVLAGRYDIVMPLEQAKIISEGIPNAQLVVFDHSGHYPFFEENYLFTQWMRAFLEFYAS